MSELKQESLSHEDMFRVLFMQQQRIYDILLTLLYHFDPNNASKVDEVHQKFDFVGSLPFKESDELPRTE